jgi:hypothetical protein
MLQVRNLSNVFQKRLIRPLYAHTQATPYAAVLDASCATRTVHSVPPLSTDTLPIARSAAAFTFRADSYRVPSSSRVQAKRLSLLQEQTPRAAVRSSSQLCWRYAGRHQGREQRRCLARTRLDVRAPSTRFDDTGLAAAYAAATPR